MKKISDMNEKYLLWGKICVITSDDPGQAWEVMENILTMFGLLFVAALSR